MKSIDPQVLFARVGYCPELGLFWSKVSAGPRRIGDVFDGVNKDGYLRICVKGVQYPAHRLAFVFMQGALPDYKLDVDHINGNRLDNRWENLRVVSRQVNIQNQHWATPRNKTSGLLGVTWDKAKGKWYACIWVNGRTLSLGRHTTAEDAHVAYIEAKRRLHAGCTI